MLGGAKKYRGPIVAAIFAAAIWGGIWVVREGSDDALDFFGSQTGRDPNSEYILNKTSVAKALEEDAKLFKFPAEREITVGGKSGSTHTVKAKIDYSFDPSLQALADQLLKLYQPDYGAMVVMDPSTGRILSLSSYSRGEKLKENLALKATFPSASVFKVITAAAAIAEGKMNAETVIPFSGRDHTLYKSAVLKNDLSRGNRSASLKNAFAKSINSVFAKIGVYSIGPESIHAYAERFGFNQPIAADFPIEVSQTPPTKDLWSLAEVASGYTRETTMSPIQGAMIAATVVNDGVMMEPYLVRSMIDSDGKPLYVAKEKISKQVLNKETATEMRQLMRETVRRGTSKRSFSGFFRREFADLDVGGKTGSLTGTEPPGKYDWFVGFADNGQERLAIAALTIHGPFWRVKSSFLARRVFEHYYGSRPKRVESAQRSMASDAKTLSDAMKAIVPAQSSNNISSK